MKRLRDTLIAECHSISSHLIALHSFHWNSFSFLAIFTSDRFLYLSLSLSLFIFSHLRPLVAPSCHCSYLDCKNVHYGGTSRTGNKRGCGAVHCIALKSIHSSSHSFKHIYPIISDFHCLHFFHSCILLFLFVFSCFFFFLFSVSFIAMVVSFFLVSSLRRTRIDYMKEHKKLYMILI